MADTLCTRCGFKMCGNCYFIQWLGEEPYCERCYEIAEEDERLNAQEANSAARRQATGAQW
uniref:Uncharacterized protein n=1 Tax=viral metagenome TaxID=1070528 RepID=A0A6M3LHQ3_9ZZZZ